VAADTRRVVVEVDIRRPVEVDIRRPVAVEVGCSRVAAAVVRSWRLPRGHDEVL
jgi:hypothetical protein